MKIKLIAIDVDGTLLDDCHQLSLDNEQAIRVALNQGVEVILATGRMRTSCEWLINKLELHAPGIFTQGLSITDAEGRQLYGEWLETAVLTHFFPFAKQHQLSFIAATDRKILTYQRDAYTDLIHDYDEPMPIEVPDLTVHPIHKLIILAKPARVQEIRPLLSAHMGERASVLITQPEMVEIMPSNTSKGHGLRWLATHLNIPLTQTMAIGNAENDIEMLKVAGLSVAVNNAATVVQAAADHIVSSNNEAGVAEAINKFVNHAL